MKAHPNVAVNRLLERKAALEARITEELKRPVPDALTLQSLKRARLELKDRVTGMLRTRSFEGVSTSARVG